LTARYAGSTQLIEIYEWMMRKFARSVNPLRYFP